MKRKEYRRPQMRVAELQNSTMLLQTSGVDANRSGYGDAVVLDDWE